MEECRKHENQLPKHVLFILSRIEAAGFSAYAVGGCVRDLILSRRPHDWDVATDAGCEQVISLFRKTVPTGVKFGTVTVLAQGGRVEVTTFRRDGTYRDGRRPESVQFVPDIKEDLSRRDFTINSMAMGVDGKILDPFGGKDDIKNGIIRCVGNPYTRFSEDALRMFRAVRFSAQLGFAIDETAWAAILECASLCENLSSERVCAEVCKMLASPRPELVGKIIEQGLMSKFLQMKRKKTNVFFENLRKLPQKGDYRLCAFVCELKRQEYLSDVGMFLKALRCPAKTVKSCTLAAKLLDYLPKDEKGLKLFLAEYGQERTLLAAAAGETVDAGRYRRVREAIRRGGFCDVKSLAVSGDDLRATGLCGEEIGAWLRKLSALVTTGEIENSYAALLQYVKNKGSAL